MICKISSYERINIYMKITGKKLSVFIICVFVLFLIPVLWISFYNVPQYDDYYYGIKTFHAWNESNNFVAVIKAALAQVKETYVNWQGTWSAVFLFAIHPGIWGREYYFLSTFILLAVMIGSTALFCHVLFRRIMHMPKYRRLILSSLILFGQIQLVPYPIQSFMWWNGSMFYTFFYSLSLVLFSLIAIYGMSDSKVTRIFSAIGACFVGLLVSGGNYVTGLLTLLILVAICIYMYTRIYRCRCINESCKREKRTAVLLTIIILVFWAGFLISVFAPGNAVRSERYDFKPGAVFSVILSFRYTLRKFYDFINLPFVLIMLLLTPFIVSSAEKSKLKFKHPLLFFIFTLLLFTAQFTPPIYGMGGMTDEGSSRIVDIIYYSCYWFFIANIYYIGGYVTHKYGVSVKRVIDIMHNKRTFGVVSIAVIFVMCMPVLNVEPNMTSASAAYSLFTNDAKGFADEWNERFDQLERKDLLIIEFKPLIHRPKLLFYDEIGSDYEWSNLPMCKYYDKDDIVIVPSDD